MEGKEMKEKAVSIKVMENGPYLVKGTFTLEMPDGKIEEKTGNTALCRCGRSKNKPYCDGSHAKKE